MSAKFTLLISAVAAMQSVAQGAEHLLADLHQRLSTAVENDDMDEVRDIVASLNASKDELAAAVVANTPAANAPQPVPPVDLGNSQGAESVAGSGLAGDSVVAPGSGNDSVGGGTGSDTLTQDTVAAASGDDSLTGGNGSDAVTTDPAPVAVISDDPAHIDPTVTADSTHTDVIVTDHPTDGTVLVTPVTSEGDVPEGSITVDPATGVPTASADSGVTLGDTTVAPDAPTAADVAAQDPTAVVSTTGDGALQGGQG